MKELDSKSFYFKKARKHKFNINLRIALIILLPFIYAFLFFTNPSEYDYSGNLKSLIIIFIDFVILIYILISYAITIKYYLPKNDPNRHWLCH